MTIVQASSSSRLLEKRIWLSGDAPRSHGPDGDSNCFVKPMNNNLETGPLLNLASVVASLTPTKAAKSTQPTKFCIAPTKSRRVAQVSIADSNGEYNPMGEDQGTVTDTHLSAGSDDEETVEEEEM